MKSYLIGALVVVVLIASYLIYDNRRDCRDFRVLERMTNLLQDATLQVPASDPTPLFEAEENLAASRPLFC